MGDPFNYDQNGVRRERTGWRCQDISQRHRVWGFDCPAVDLDFLVCEYNIGKPVALIEYKHANAQMPNPNHATYRALRDLADGYQDQPLPFLLVFYWPEIWAFRAWCMNDAARLHFSDGEVLCERDFVRKLYRARRKVLAAHLEGKLNTELPQAIAAE